MNHCATEWTDSGGGTDFLKGDCMTIELAALAIFVGVFAVSALRNVHLGVLMFAAACGVGISMADMPLDDVLAGFPLGILVLLVGVTYFFGIAHANGTIDRLIDTALERVGDRTALLPPVFFLLTAAISAMGSPLGGLVMAPVGMTAADRRGIDPMLMGLAIGTGLSAGAFAPTSLFGIITYGTAHTAGIELSPILPFVAALVVNVVLLAVAFCLFGGLKLLRTTSEQTVTATVACEQLVTVGAAGPGPDRLGAGPTTASTRSSGGGSGRDTAAGREPYSFTQKATVTAIIGLIATVIALSLTGHDPDIGVLSFAFAAVLVLIDPVAGKNALPKIDWSTVLLVGGIITFVGVLEELGAVDLFGTLATSIGVPLISALFICVVAGLVSAFASTTGMLAALVPLALPLIATGNIPGWALICAIGVCASIVDVSPFSTVGATLVATTVDEAARPRMTRLLLRWGMSMVVVGPVVLVAGLIVPGMLM